MSARPLARKPRASRYLGGIDAGGREANPSCIFPCCLPMNTSTSCSRLSPTRTAGARISFVSFHTQRPILTALPCFVDIPNRGSSGRRYCSTGYNLRFGWVLRLPSFVRRRGRNGALTRGDLNAEHGLRARISRGWRARMRPIASAGAVKAIAAAIALPLLSGCAGLHLDQEPDQVIQRTEGEDNYAEKQKAGPVAARVLPYALLAEQSYDPEVYATHRIAPRASACVADDPRIATRAPTTNARPVGSMNGATSGAVMDRTNAECGRPGRASLSRTAWGFKSGRASG